MYGFLKCYYGYQNFGDELLFFGVLDRIRNNSSVTNIFIEVGDKQRMTQRCAMHADIIKDIGITCHIVDKSEDYILPADCLYFFGGGEVLNDQDTYILPQSPSIKHRIIHFFTKRFTRSGRNYYIKYHRIIQSGQFYLLGGIGKPYKTMTQWLYKRFLPKAQGIVARDATSYHLALQYNKNSQLYHDFSNYIIDHYRLFDSTPPYESESYILINTQHHTRNDHTLSTIQLFVAAYPDKIPVYFPCDMSDDRQYFDILDKHIVGLQLYDWTQHTLTDTLALFAHAATGIGSRLHFLYPLHSFGKSYTSLATKDKVSKLLSPTSIDAV